ncbi:Cell cycle regulated microtubule associated protein [Euphorbia peplus]|nr:Cell cycle regulated microtubule associated protein [Euphorbia peplus]
METEMEMEDEMEAEFVFEAREVDPDYEFDASMFFDFTREESPIEAFHAESWFNSAPNYPPSPFVAKLVLRESLLEDPRSKGVGNGVTLLCDGYSQGFRLVESEECNKTCGGIFTNLRVDNFQKGSNRPPALATGFTTYSHMYSGNSKATVKKPAKSNLPRSSTLMKPTASMLAKQTRAPQIDGSRFQTLLLQKEKSLCNPSENQAAKRQKLEGGHSCKVGDAKQQNDFVHKEPKKDGTRLRITIPREPDLETANRAQRTRPKDNKEVKDVPMVARRFKARPLNRKILDAPSLPLPKKSTPKLPEFHEFHLKTLERATQHTSGVSASSHQHNDFEQGSDIPSRLSVAANAKTESRRPSAMDCEKVDGGSNTHVFKARPLNKKILTSKGDLGIFRNSKRETTVPTEFNFHTEKRMQYHLPTELFNKLSLTSELQPNNGSQLQIPRSTSIFSKGSKENRLNPLQPEHKMTQSGKEKPFIFGGKPTQRTEVGNQLSLRSLGVR